MKRILVPTDFSENAEDALKVAAQIAKKNNSEIIILHILELPATMNDPILGGVSIPESMLFMKKADEMLSKITKSRYLQGLTVTEITKLDRPAEGIINVSNDREVDLIVMGSRGSSGFQELFIGSNTEKVVRHSEIPVLVIKKEMDEFKTTNFVFASDFSKEIEKPFKKMLEFAKLFNSKLHLVMICTPSSFKPTRIAQKIMNDFIAPFKLDNYSTHIYNDTNIENGIIHFSDSINADLIGMCTHGRTGFSNFFNGSIGEDLVNHAIRPIMTFKIV